MRYLSETRSRKPTLAAAGSAALRGGRLRIPQPTPQPLVRAWVLFSPFASESEFPRVSERSRGGKRDPGRLYLGRRVEIPRGSDGAQGRRGAEFRARGKLKLHGEDWLFRTRGRSPQPGTRGRVNLTVVLQARRDVRRDGARRSPQLLSCCLRSPSASLLQGHRAAHVCGLRVTGP